MKRLFTTLVLIIITAISYAQIGYQVSLLNSATSEPRTNETVNVTINITDSSNSTLYSQTQSATTNDFGILALTVGNADTFKDINEKSLPLYVSATVDGIMIGKTQILNVPVAEYAKKAGSVEGQITKEMLVGKWKCMEDSYESTCSYTFNEDGTGEYTILFSDRSESREFFKYFIGIGNVIVFDSFKYYERDEYHEDEYDINDPWSSVAVPISDKETWFILAGDDELARFTRVTDGK